MYSQHQGWNYNFGEWRESNPGLLQHAGREAWKLSLCYATTNWKLDWTVKTPTCRFLQLFRNLDPFLLHPDPRPRLEQGSPGFLLGQLGPLLHLLGLGGSLGLISTNSSNVVLSPDMPPEKFYQTLQKTLPLLHHETSALHLRRRHCRSAMELFST